MSKYFWQNKWNPRDSERAWNKDKQNNTSNKRDWKEYKNSQKDWPFHFL